MEKISSVIKVIEKINDSCCELVKIKKMNIFKYQSEKSSVDQQSSKLILTMREKYENFKNNHFLRLKTEIQELVKTLSIDYSIEWKNVNAHYNSHNLFDEKNFEELEKILSNLVFKMNEYVIQLNNINFDKLVPPVKVQLESNNGETFYVINNNKTEKYDYSSKQMIEIRDPKPIRNIAIQIFICCRQAQICLQRLEEIYDKQFAIAEFEKNVRKKEISWLEDFKKNWIISFLNVMKNCLSMKVRKQFRIVFLWIYLKKEKKQTLI